MGGRKGHEGVFQHAGPALHHNSGSDTRGGSSGLNKPPLLVVACNFGARPGQVKNPRPFIYPAD